MRTWSGGRPRTGTIRRARLGVVAAPVVVAMVAIVLAGCGATHPAAAPAPAAPAPVAGNPMASQLIALHNGARAGAGIGPLVESATLDGGAQATANRLVATSGAGCNLVHTSVAQMDSWYGGTWGENIACAPDPAAGACASMQTFEDLFINSPPHRANILNGAYGHAGVGIACGGAFTFVAVHFGP